MRRPGADNQKVSIPARVQHLAVAAAMMAFAALLLVRPEVRPSTLLRDFNAFYCAGASIDRGADPYRAEPLGACERAPRPAGFGQGMANLAMPAPLPPYALAPFTLLAKLPYGAAAAMWVLCLLAAFALTIGAMRRLTNLPLPALIAAFALTDGFAGIALGQIAPMAIAAIALAALFAERGQDRAAAIAAAVAMIEPHVGLPAALALFVWRPQARVPLALAGAICVGLSLALTGLANNLEYVRNVLPAHAFSEIVNQKQFSLTYILHRLGVDDANALHAGNLSYLMMLVLGIAAAPVIAKRSASAGAIVAFPVAAALVGGPFSHIVQLAAVLPAALLLYARVPSLRAPLGIAIAALAVPWVQFTTLGTLFPILTALVVAVLIAYLVDRRTLVFAGASLLCLIFLEIASGLVTQLVPDPAALLAAHYDPSALAEASWNLYVRTVGVWNAAAFDLAKAPTWLAVAAIAIGGFGVALRSETPENFAACENGNSL